MGYGVMGMGTEMMNMGMMNTGIMNMGMMNQGMMGMGMGMLDIKADLEIEVIIRTVNAHINSADVCEKGCVHLGA